MRPIIKFFIDNPISGNILMLMILLFGWFGLKNMKSTFFPPVPLQFVEVKVVYPGASPEEIEEGVVLRIEETLVGVTGIEQVNSTSSENAALIRVEMKRGEDIEKLKQDIENAVDQASNFFAPGVEKPIITIVENRNFAYSFALSGDVPLQVLKQTSRRVEDELRATGIMSKIAVTGFPREEIEIAFRENDLIRYQITIAEAGNAVRANNIDVTGGRLKGEAEELLLRARNKGYRAEELKNIIVKTTADGTPIRLYQIADVTDRWEDVPQRSYLNGKPSVVVTIQNTDDEDMLTIADYMVKYVDDFNKKNESVKATTIRDGSIILRQRIDLLTENGVIGFFLVLICLGLFLHWRIAFWVAASIPVAFAGMFIFGAWAGITINVISLFGMILVVGILVDDGIVVSENVYTYYERGMSPKEAAIAGTMDVLGSVFSAVLTTIIAFSIFFFLEGRIGDMFKDLAIVVIITLSFSLIEAMFILPAHLAHSAALHEDPHHKNIILRAMDRVMDFMRDKLYAPLLRFCINGTQRLIAIAFFVGLLIMTFAAFSGGRIKATFFPFIERDDIQVTLNMPAGTRENITMEWLGHIEKTMWEINKELTAQRTDSNQVVLKIEKNVQATGYQGSLNISLLDGETRKMGVLEITEILRKRIGEIPNAESLSYGSASPFGKPISVSVLGTDFVQLEKAVEMLKTELKKEEGLKDILDNNYPGLREVDIDLNDKGRQLGLNLQEVLTQVRQGFFGNEVQNLQRGRDEVRIWLRYDTQDRASLGQLENMRIRFTDGREYLLSDIANFSINRGVVNINHINGKREIKVEADIASKKVSVLEITNKVKNEIAPRVIAAYPSVRLQFEGQNKEQQRTMNSIQRALPIVLLIMFIAIVLTFGSLSQALVVAMAIPFGFIGVGWGHYFMDAQISIFSVLGIIALLGVMVNDSLVFIETLNQNLAAGVPYDEAIYKTGVSRFRAILLTSLTTILGLGPLMLETSFQAQFLVPMAISVAFGLLAATFVTLVLVPVFLLLVNRYKVYTLWLWSGKRPTPEEVEHAVPGRRNAFFLWFLGGLVLWFLVRSFMG